MNMLLSIIVPVYNAEQYLSRCINSLLNQHLNNFEIILVDDGSNDGSAKICDDYAQKNDDIIHVIHTANGGVSRARNIGINAAQGEYITFVDSDDYVLPDILSVLFENILNNSFDIIQFLYIISPDIINYKTIKRDIEINDNNKAIKYCFYPKYIQNSACCKLFRKELLYNVRFDESLKYAEDQKFVIECCSKANRIKLLNIKGYVYWQNDGSTMHQPLSENRFDILSVCDWAFNSFNNKRNKRLVHVCEIHYCVDLLLRIINEERCFNRISELRERIKRNLTCLLSPWCSMKDKFVGFSVLFNFSLFRKYYNRRKRMK